MPKLIEKANMQPKLFPLIEQLVPLVGTQLDTQRWSLVKCGMRSGKSTLASEVARNYDKCYLFSPHDIPIPFSIPIERVLKLPSSVENGEENGVLILIEDAMYIPGSYDIFDACRKCAPTLVISSRGPEYDNDPRWKLIPGFSLATWDANPSCTYESSLSLSDSISAHLGQSRADVIARFIRDFGAF